jgi:SNF2 family DNA or RNA helicase
MTPYEQARERFNFPFPLRPYQIDSVNQLCENPLAGYYWEPGAGKTSGATHQALYEIIRGNAGCWVIVVPPILIPQWATWIRKVTDKTTGKALTAVEYKGTPKQRTALDLNVDVVVLSYQVFKLDFESLWERIKPRRPGLICDEATAIKNITTDTHRAVALFAEGAPLLLLTGTPLNKPGDAYGYMKLIAPGLYRNQRMFDRMHIEETDEYNKVIKWANLDILERNMKVNSHRILIREHVKDMPPVQFTPIVYDLEKEHLKLYQRIAEERLLQAEDGSGYIDAISSSKLRAALQQVILNWGHFADDPSKEPAALELIYQTLDEIAERKLVVVANFRRSNAYLLEKLGPTYGAVAIYGDVSPKGKQLALKKFTESDACRVIILHPESAGFGVDGLQHVCHDMLVVEAPTTPTPFNQVVARLDRDGQKSSVNCRVAIARGTVQARMFRGLLEKDALVNSVQGSFQDLRDAIFGD